MYENANWKFKFKIGYPTVAKVSKFYSSRYLNMRKLKDKTSIESFNTSVNVDYVNLFIKEIEFTDKSTEEVNTIDIKDYTLEQMFDVISVFPQDVLYSENGTIAYITSEFITKINDMFDKHRCAICGTECENTADSDTNGFF